MLKLILGIIGGLIAWMLFATLGNLAIRAALPGYAAAEAAMAFTPAMMFARLLLGALSSLAAGLVAAWITRRNNRAIIALAAILLVIFIPVHYGLWEKFPAWYHLVFLLSLVIMTPLGAALFRPGDRA